MCRLPFFLHCGVQAVSLALTLLSLPDLCAQYPPLQQPTLAALYELVEGWMSRLNEAPVPDMLVRLLWRRPGPAASSTAAGSSVLAAEQEPMCSCVAVLATLAVVVGYLLPGLLVAHQERTARAVFAEELLVQGGWDGLAEEGWTLGEQRYHLLYDPLLTWVWALSLLPLVVFLVWHTVQYSCKAP